MGGVCGSREGQGSGGSPGTTQGWTQFFGGGGGPKPPMDTEVRGAVPPTGLLGKSGLGLWGVCQAPRHQLWGLRGPHASREAQSRALRGGEARCRQQPTPLQQGAHWKGGECLIPASRSFQPRDPRFLPKYGRFWPTPRKTRCLNPSVPSSRFRSGLQGGCVCLYPHTARGHP